jgi:Flp pilus assembly protein TadG
VSGERISLGPEIRSPLDKRGGAVKTRVQLASERGQAMTEMAIVLPILCVLLFGILEFGIVFNRYLTITDAVRAGARVAAVSRFQGDPVGITVARVRSAAGDLDQSKLQVSVTGDWDPGGSVVVQATYPYSIDLLGLVVKAGNLTSKTTERVE